MKILLLTNDDGIDSEGLIKLAEVLRSKGIYRVFVIAPDADRSGVSHGLSIMNDPVKLCSLGEDTWSCSGNPVDCVIAGVLGALPVRPDLVLSGINRGANLGTDLIFSGTAAAARQASLFHIPGIALSLHRLNDDDGNVYLWDMAASWAVDHLEELSSFWREYAFVNVNIPNSPGGPQGIVTSWPAVKSYSDKLEVKAAPDGSLLCSLLPGKETTVKEPGSDCDVVSRNYVSVSSVVNLPAVLGDLCPGAPAHAALADRVADRDAACGGRKV